MRRAARPVLYLGIAAVVLGLSKIHAAYVANPPYVFHGSSRFAWALAYILLLGLAAYGLGLPDLPRNARQALTTAASAAAAGALAISLVQLVVGDALLPRFVVFGSAILLIPWYLTCAAFATDAAAGAAGRDRVLLVSDSASGTVLRQEIARSAEHPARLVGVATVAESEPQGVDDHPLIDRLAHDHISVIVLDRDAQASAPVVAQVAVAHQQGARVRTLSLFYEEWLGMLPVSELERVSLLFDIGELHRGRYGRIKRIIDFVVAVVAMPFLLVAALGVALGNLVGNRGRLLYSQPRIGKNGETFTIYKFRSMRAGADGPGAEVLDGEWTAKRDPRITPFGRALRVSHLDELPQMFNILKGDLALVGPRPEQPQYVAELRDKLPFYDVRHLVRPGLTGWAQVKYGYAGDERDALEKLQYEFYYLRHQSIGLDARIVGRTVRSVVGGGGR